MRRFLARSLSAIIIFGSAFVLAYQQIPFGFFKTNSFTFSFPESKQLSISTYTDTSAYDFGRGGLIGVDLKNVSGGELKLSDTVTYTTNDNYFSPKLPNNEVRRIVADPSKDLIYVGTLKGIAVIDTHGSANPVDHTLLATYDMSSSAVQLCSGDLNDMIVDTTSGVIFVAIGGCGFRAIDTKNNKNPADDVMLTDFSGFTIPSVGGITGWAYSVMLDPVSHYLYLGTSGQGLLIIDTKGTTDVAQWVYLGRYNSGSTPAIADGWVLHADLNHANGLLYVSTNGGLYVIDTQSTDSLADDTLVFNYNSTGSVPAVSNNWNQYSFRDDNGVIYASGSYFAAIDTNGTTSAADDTEIGRYGNGVLSPAFSWSGSGYFDSSSKYLYLHTGSGLQIIDTKGTKSTADDTVVKVYSTSSSPAIASTDVRASYWDAAHSQLYVGTAAGLSIVNTGGYLAGGVYVSRRMDLATLPSQSVTWTPTLPANTAVSLQVRTSVDAVWIDEFADNSNSEYAGDAYGWGGAFVTAVESGGSIKLSNAATPWTNNGSTGVDSWISTGMPGGYFPIGSKITARVRVNSSTRQTSPNWNGGCVWLFTDDWWDSGYTVGCPDNQWQEFSFFVWSKTFSKIGIEFGWQTGTWDNVNDSLEIDWIKIEAPGPWGSWSTVCSNPASCTINQASLAGMNYLQYRLNFDTTDMAAAPSVSDVTLSGLYKNSERVSSGALLFPAGTELIHLTGSVVTPVNTSVAFEYSIDNGLTWTATSLPVSFPSNTIATLFRWRATLATTDLAVTPTLSNLKIESSNAYLSYVPASNSEAIEVEANKLAYINPGTYTFTVPPGFTKIEVYTLGGGGSGGTSNSAGSSASGGGGGGGGYYISSKNVSQGQSFTVVVGGGGVAADATGNGSSGGQSSFGTVAYGNGGGGGQYATANGSGGAGGASSGTGGVAVSGGAGGAGGATWYAGNGGGAACPVGNGGAGAATGDGYGSGGGGAGFSNAGSPSTGGTGSSSTAGAGGCGGGDGGSYNISSTNAVGASLGNGIDYSGSGWQGGGGFGGGGGGSWSSGLKSNSGGGGGGMVWVRLFN